MEPGRPLAVMERSPVYLQYRLELATSNVGVAPAVREIDFRWTGDLPTRAGQGRRRSP